MRKSAQHGLSKPDSVPSRFRRSGARGATWRSLRLFSAAVAVVGCQPPEVAAQGREPSWEVVFENDIFVGMVPGRPHSDREYTHGLWIASDRDDAPGWGRLFETREACRGSTGGGPCLQSRWEIGQKIYTPYLQDLPPSPVERPYAGWLYGEATGRVASDAVVRAVSMQLGVTGPPSLAETFQKFVHRVTQYPQPRGWDYQLEFEPAVVLRYEERHARVLSSGPAGRRADLLGGVGVNLGNLNTGVDASLALRAGSALPHPWLRAGPQGEGWEGFGFIEYRRKLTFHDLFLDGSTFAESPSVERIVSTGELRIGGALDYRDWRLRFTHVLQDRLYETQPKPHRYSSLALIWHP